MMEIQVTKVSVGKKEITIEDITAIHTGCGGTIDIDNTSNLPYMKKPVSGLCVITCQKCNVQAIIGEKTFLSFAVTEEGGTIDTTLIIPNEMLIVKGKKPS